MLQRLIENSCFPAIRLHRTCVQPHSNIECRKNVALRVSRVCWWRRDTELAIWNSYSPYPGAERGDNTTCADGEFNLTATLGSPSGMPLEDTVYSTDLRSEWTAEMAKRKCGNSPPRGSPRLDIARLLASLLSFNGNGETERANGTRSRIIVCEICIYIYVRMYACVCACSIAARMNPSNSFNGSLLSGRIFSHASWCERK